MPTAVNAHMFNENSRNPESDRALSRKYRNAACWLRHGDVHEQVQVPTVDDTLRNAGAMTTALNMEYLQAEFYACASTGAGIPAELRGGGPSSLGCRKAAAGDTFLHVRARPGQTSQPVLQVRTASAIVFDDPACGADVARAAAAAAAAVSILSEAHVILAQV